MASFPHRTPGRLIQLAGHAAHLLPRAIEIYRDTRHVGTDQEGAESYTAMRLAEEQSMMDQRMPNVEDEIIGAFAAAMARTAVSR